MIMMMMMVIVRLVMMTMVMMMMMASICGWVVTISEVEPRWRRLCHSTLNLHLLRLLHSNPSNELQRTVV